MVSILRAAGSRRVSAGDRVQVSYRGVSYVGTVIGARHKQDQYVIRIRPSRHTEAYLSRKRYQIEPIADVEFEDVITQCNHLEELCTETQEELCG